MEYWQHGVQPNHEIKGETLTIWVATVDRAGTGLEVALTVGPEIRTIRLLLDSTSESLAPWLESARTAAPEARGMMVQSFFARILTRAGYRVVVGRELDIFARGRLRSLFIEVKSSLKGGQFGSNKVMAQLDSYLIPSQRRAAERWLGTMGIVRPMELRLAFRSKMRIRNIGHLDLRWVSPQDSLL
jgi:hypothetical protein